MNRALRDVYEFANWKEKERDVGQIEQLEQKS